MNADEDGLDEQDRLPSSLHVGWFDLLLLVVSILLHFFDVGYDIYIAYSYYAGEKYVYFTWTVVFITIPTVIMTVISIKMYQTDSEKTGDRRYAVIRIAFCILGMIFQSALVIRYCDAIWHGVRSSLARSRSDRKKQYGFYKLMMNENADVALLRVFECYIEAALQQVLQLTFMVTDYSIGDDRNKIQQIISVSSCFVTMGCCMAIYHRAIRFDQEHKKNISIIGSIVQFFWHLNFTVSRILALTAVAIVFPLWTSVAVICHWMAMAIWVCLTNENFFNASSKFFDLFFSASVALTYIFNFLTLKDGPTRKYYSTYYLLCFVENVIAITLWGVSCPSVIKPWVYYIFLISPIVTFILGMVCLGVYYQYLHPNKVLEVKY